MQSDSCSIMKINKRLLPIKAHYFFFMAAMGPILPQLSVFGKEMGISSIVMGSINGFLPIMFLIAKPIFGIVVDVYRNQRKTIFMGLIVMMTISYGLMNFIPAASKEKFYLKNGDCHQLDRCNVTVLNEESRCGNTTSRVTCVINGSFGTELASGIIYRNGTLTSFCSMDEANHTCTANFDLDCEEDLEATTGCLYKTFHFWSFVLLMSVGTIGFNVINSISDAICFDVIGDQHDYGKQRVWGTIGFGTTALIAGYVVNIFSHTVVTYTPAFAVMLFFSVCDLFSCVKLKLPIIESPENIFKDLKRLMNNRVVITFIVFAVIAGILDSFMIYFLFWYLEDLAKESFTGNIKLIEGLIVAAETLGGEVIFFSISGKILERFGHVHSFSMCFINYALRLGLISIVPSPWWILPVEFIFQGPTYAMTYTTIVAYANVIAPPGASATMQGIAAGMDDGFGYAIGSIVGGFLYRYLGGRGALQVFSALGVVASISHLILHKTLLRDCKIPEATVSADYKTPAEAALTADEP